VEVTFSKTVKTVPIQLWTRRRNGADIIRSGILEGSMQEYEIRVLAARSSPSLIMKTMHFTDIEAIKAGRKIAGDHRFEVWRDMECIHGPADDEPIPFPIRRLA
jgi:hypothetical protein